MLVGPGPISARGHISRAKVTATISGKSILQVAGESGFAGSAVNNGDGAAQVSATSNVSLDAEDWEDLSLLLVVTKIKAADDPPPPFNGGEYFSPPGDPYGAEDPTGRTNRLTDGNDSTGYVGGGGGSYDVGWPMFFGSFIPGGARPGDVINIGFRTQGGGFTVAYGNFNDFFQSYTDNVGNHYRFAGGRGNLGSIPASGGFIDSSISFTWTSGMSGCFIAFFGAYAASYPNPSPTPIYLSECSVAGGTGPLPGDTPNNQPSLSGIEICAGLDTTTGPPPPPPPPPGGSGNLTLTGASIGIGETDPPEATALSVLTGGGGQIWALTTANENGITHVVSLHLTFAAPAGKKVKSYSVSLNATPYGPGVINQTGGGAHSGSDLSITVGATLHEPLGSIDSGIIVTGVTATATFE